MSHQYSEDGLIESTCMKIFKDRLGWGTVNAFHESLGRDGTLGRSSEAEVILKGRFLQALERLNPGLPRQAYELAYELIAQRVVTKSLAELNHDKYGYLKDGIPVTYKDVKGRIVPNKKLKVLDFPRPEENDFLAVRQMWVEGKSRRRRRPDIVGFVNGVPLLFMELKAHHRKLRVAYDENLSDYKDTIPQLFHCNAFIILSNGIDSKIGAITSRYEHFNDWKRIREDEEGVISLDTILCGVCEKSRFLDLFENFILYDTQVGKDGDTSSRVVKLIARNHQFIGVNKAIDHFRELNEKYARGEITAVERQKLGVFWHTQGSGKSYSMVFLCQKIHRKMQGPYTFLLVTDRKELDTQIYGTFQGVGAVEDNSTKAGSGEGLQKLLETDARYIFTLIHKFNFNATVTERDNIIVLSDEAHRTQGGSLALNMREALPNASFMGFTGTPLFKDDELTRRIFGDYVSVYDFKRSIEDGATVPLYYENRGEKLKLDNPEINDQIREAIAEAEPDSDQQDKLKRLFAREYPILTAKKRLRAIARDIVWHFNERGYQGKGILVCLDKLTAVKMYDFITEEWQNYVTEKEREVEKMNDLQEQQVQRRALNLTRRTEIAVVISEEQNEIRKFSAYGLDIEPHRAKMKDPSRDLEAEFKDEDHPFRLVIVCAMWITGFDVKSLSTLYLDKPLKAHTLMQTISRANRVLEGKNNGLIVDYIETYKSLLEALAVYAIGENKTGGGARGKEANDAETPVKPLEELAADLEKAVSAVVTFLSVEVNFDLDLIVHAEDNLHRIKYIAEGENAIYTTDETKHKFGVLAREVFKKFRALMPGPEVYAFRPRRDAIDALYRRIQDNTEEADITGVMKEVQDIVDHSVESLSISMEPTADYGKKVDLSKLDFDLVEKHFLKTVNKNTVVRHLRKEVERQLERMVDQNPLRIDFLERYNEIIEEYNRGKEQVTIETTFKKLKNYIRDLSEEEARAQREGLDEDQLAIFDLLHTGKELSTQDRNKVKAVAAELLETLQQNKLLVDHWPDKTQTSAAVSKAISYFFFEQLPYPTYGEQDIDTKALLVFEHIKMRYRGGAA